MKNLILIGGSGHCRSVIDVVESSQKFKIKGILDHSIEQGARVLNYKVLGGDELIPELIQEKNLFLVAIGFYDSSPIRKKIYETVKNYGGNFATVVASSAVVSKHAEIGEGTIVMHNSLVNTNAKVGVNNILNTASIIEHDCVIGDHNHVSTAATINGKCTVNSNCFIGSNVCVNDGITIGDNSIIASGSLVTKDLPGNKVYMGFPVKLG